MFSLYIRAIVFFGILAGVFCMSIQNETAYENKLEALEKSLEIIESRLGNMSEKMNNMTKLYNNPMQHVSFYVEKSTTTLHYNSIVKFDYEYIDKGNNFNTGDGIFIAPVAGVYLFSWTIHYHSGKSTHTELRVDNNVKGRLDSNSPSGHYSTSRVVICDVKKGDHVWIQSGGYYTENYLLELHGTRSSFMGFLIHEK